MALVGFVAERNIAGRSGEAGGRRMTERGRERKSEGVEGERGLSDKDKEPSTCRSSQM